MYDSSILDNHVVSHGWLKKQYHCAYDIYLKSYTFLEFCIIIYRTVYEHGDGKDVGDGLNSIYKRMNKFPMENILNTELICNDSNFYKFMQFHKNKGCQAVSLAIEYQFFLSLLHTIDTENNKHQENIKFYTCNDHI